MFLTFSLVALLSFSNATGPVPQKGTDNVQTTITQDGFVDIFDKKTLKGWSGDPVYWHVVDGVLTGETKESLPPLKSNTFLIWEGGQPGDFELKVEYKISSVGNSGIQYRSEYVDGVPFALKGYQADIDGRNNYTGQNYEERKRTTLAYRGQIVEVPTELDTAKAKVARNAWRPVIVKDSLGTAASLKSVVRDNDWNECRIVAKGNRIQHYINGVLMSDVLDNDTVNRKLSGYLGLQMHVGPPMKIEFRSIKIKQ
ncbi:DUF1080 domain-containing protein [Albibacterium sp.]|uniref:3-keto-disaccharide hydrolase n=1 Tax=Albibacterium sp. TaxID=2952885 RepID=UPI002C85FFDF|nr:DUF1080 domain-containing protein [Albibacterium sp.]HUH19164.1 DUF1080 domain-containing protein [Albibacterium sp.]